MSYRHLSFEDRLLLGTSLPTLDDKLRNLYEPHVPHPKQRLKLLTDAHAAGINTYVAVAPVFPEVGYKGMLEVFKAVKAAGLSGRLHLWPDHEALNRRSVVDAQENPEAYLKWLQGYWDRVSEWPVKRRRK